MDTGKLDNLATALAEMTREQLVDTLHETSCAFPLDFTDEFLASVSVDRLRHITLAASLHRLHPCA